MKMYVVARVLLVTLVAAVVPGTSGDPENGDGGEVTGGWESSYPQGGKAHGGTVEDDSDAIAAAIFGSPYDARARFASLVSDNTATGSSISGSGHHTDDDDTQDSAAAILARSDDEFSDGSNHGESIRSDHQGEMGEDGVAGTVATTETVGTDDQPSSDATPHEKAQALLEVLRKRLASERASAKDDANQNGHDEAVASKTKGNWRRRSSTLGPKDTPLQADEFLSCACAATSDGISNIPRQTAYRSAHSIVGDGLCVSTTHCGSLRVNRGFEPSDDPESVVWEGEVKERKKGSWWRKVLKEAETTEADTEGGQDEGSQDKSSTEMMVHRGRVSVVRKRPTTRRKLSGFFYGGKYEKREKTFQSPRPAGYWRTYFSLVDGKGRDIRNAELAVTPDGRVAMATPTGRVLWEPRLDI